jgi:hypothetical protein
VTSPSTIDEPDVGADDEDELEMPVDHDCFSVNDLLGRRMRKVGAPPLGVNRWEERRCGGAFEVWLKHEGSGETPVERETLLVQDGERRMARVGTLMCDGGAPETPAAPWRYQMAVHLGTWCGEATETGLVIGWEEYHSYGTTADWSFNPTRDVLGRTDRHSCIYNSHFRAARK